jgi:hypothetical protein
MSGGWWFYTHEGVVHLIGRAVSDDGSIVGHSWGNQVEPGGSFYGLDYATLVAAGAGKLHFTDSGDAIIV